MDLQDQLAKAMTVVSICILGADTLYILFCSNLITSSYSRYFYLHVTNGQTKAQVKGLAQSHTIKDMQPDLNLGLSDSQTHIFPTTPWRPWLNLFLLRGAFPDHRLCLSTGALYAPPPLAQHFLISNLTYYSFTCLSIVCSLPLKPRLHEGRFYTYPYCLEQCPEN